MLKYDPATRAALRAMHARGLTEAQHTGLLEVRARVAAMLKERTPGTATPSAGWLDGCAFFSYSFDLAPEAWTRLRLHTYHLTGDNYQTYLFGRPAGLLAKWATEVGDLPAALWLSEPAGGIGFAYDGRLISNDLLRFQHVVGTLHRYGVLPQLRAQEHAMTLEIGSGYAGLAYHLHRILGRGTCVLVDLPETLLFAGAYLTLHRPEGRIYVYRADDATAALADPRTYDFILLPNFRLDLLTACRFDLVISVETLQGMRPDQIEEYLSLIARTSQLLYSWDLEENPANPELDRLSPYLHRYFNLTRVPPPTLPYKARLRTAVKRWLRHGLAPIGLAQDPRHDSVLPPAEYLCRPRSAQ